MSEVIVFGLPLSGYVRSVRMACEEKGVPHVVEPLGPRELAENGRHPFGKMPTMEHDGFRLFESSAILRYIDRNFEGPALEPRDPKQAALSVQWESALHDYVLPTMGRRYAAQYFFPSGPDGQPNRTVIDAALPDMKRYMAILSGALEEGPCFFGAAPTIPDLLLAPMLALLKGLPESAELLAANRPVRRLLEFMEGRDSFQRTLPPPMTEAA